MIISAQVVLGYVGSKNLRRRKWRSGPLPEGEGRYDYSETARRPTGTGAVSCFLSLSHLDPLSVCICFEKKNKCYNKNGINVNIPSAVDLFETPGLESKHVGAHKMHYLNE